MELLTAECLYRATEHSKIAAGILQTRMKRRNALKDVIGDFIL